MMLWTPGARCTRPCDSRREASRHQSTRRERDTQSRRYASWISLSVCAEDRVVFFPRFAPAKPPPAPPPRASASDAVATSATAMKATSRSVRGIASLHRPTVIIARQAPRRKARLLYVESARGLPLLAPADPPEQGQGGDRRPARLRGRRHVLRA